MIRLYETQLDSLAGAMGEDPVSRVEAHLRTHYPDQCELYEAAALRAWIAEALEQLSAYCLVGTDELFLQISKRWVLRAWFGEPAARKEPPR